jgi:hypothetical protein
MLSLLAGSALADPVFTPTNGPTCKDYSKPQFGHWVCPGPGGYAVAFMDEGNVAGLKIAPASAIRKGTASEQWLGSGQVFGHRAQWVLRDGAPKAAIIRIWRRKSEDSTELQELQVYAIDGAKACPVATVEARMAKANETALARAEQAVGWRCTEK